jgi:hypothetical protein
MTNRLLAKEICRRVDAEQKVRILHVGGKAKRSEYKKIDRENSKWSQQVFKEYGYPRISLVGKLATDGIWLMVQHADHDLPFQKKALQLMIRLQRKYPQEIRKKHIAYLTDRILYNEKKPLRFGLMYKTKGVEVFALPIRDAKYVNQRRKEYGITTTVESRRRALIRELKKLGAK